MEPWDEGHPTWAVPTLNLRDKVQLLGKGDDETFPCQIAKEYVRICLEFLIYINFFCLKFLRYELL